MDMDMSNVQNVKWLDYTNNLMDIQKSIYLSSSMFDVIIAVGETRFKAHQLVLSACSDFFIDILANCSNSIIPTIIIPEINPKLFDPLLVFIYTGETYVTSNSLPEFLDLCRFLKIKGFPPPETPSSPPAQATTTTTTLSSQTPPILDENTPSIILYNNLLDPGLTLQTQTTSAAAAAAATPATIQDRQQNTGHILFPPDQFSANIKTSQFVSSNKKPFAANISNQIDDKIMKNNFIIENDIENITNIDDLVVEEEEDDEEELEEDVDDENIDDEEQFEVVEIYENSSTGHEECISETKLIDEEFLDDDLVSQSHQPPLSLTLSTENNSFMPPPITQTTEFDIKNPTTTPTNPPNKQVDEKIDHQQQSTKQQFTNEHLTLVFDALKMGKSVVDIAHEYGISKSTIYTKLRENPEYRLMYRSLRTRIIEDAVHAVAINGISRKEASAKFNISKTVLWRKLKQSNLYRPEDWVKNASRTEALNAMAKGETLVSVSKKYNIPLSTLHRYKVRLYSEGKLPTHCKLTRRDSGPGYKKRVRAAVESCERGMPQKLASEVHGVPKTTIWRHLHAAAKRKQQQKVQNCGELDDDGSRNGEDVEADDDHDDNDGGDDVQSIKEEDQENDLNLKEFICGE